jgi:hypothetical protein
MRENGSPISPTDFLVLTKEAEGHTSFDVYLSSQPGVTFAASIPPASVAGRIFRELSFLPRWHTEMLLLQEIPFLRAFGGEIRFRLGDNTLALPGYMLADLDYTRGAQPGERAARYESYAGAFAATPSSGSSCCSA